MSVKCNLDMVIEGGIQMPARPEIGGISFIRILALLVILGIVTVVVLIATRKKQQNRLHARKGPIIILASVSVVLSLLSGVMSVPLNIYTNYGVPLDLVQLVSSILFLVLCIFVDKKPELTVIPKCLLVADYVMFLIRGPLSLNYPLRFFLRQMMFENIDLVLTVIFLTVYFLSISAKIKKHDTAKKLTVIFGILSCLYNPSARGGFSGFRTLITLGLAYAIEIMTVIAMVKCVSYYSRHEAAYVEDEAESVTESEPAAAAAAPAASTSSGAPSNSLFETDFLVVDEKVRAFSFGSAYGIYADGTEPVGFVRQANYSGGAKAAQIMFGRKMKNMQSFEFEITDASGKRVGGISRKGMALISVEDASGNTVGKLKFGKLIDDNGTVLATAKAGGLTKTRILDENNEEMATINYKWNGVVKTLLTSADKYLVLFANDLDPVKKANVLAICIAFDFVSSS